MREVARYLDFASAVELQALLAEVDIPVQIHPPQEQPTDGLEERELPAYQVLVPDEWEQKTRMLLGMLDKESEVIGPAADVFETITTLQCPSCGNDDPELLKMYEIKGTKGPMPYSIIFVLYHSLHSLFIGRRYQCATCKHIWYPFKSSS